MSSTEVTEALSRVVDILSSSPFLDKEVFILIPHIRLANEAATEKVSFLSDLHL